MASDIQVPNPVHCFLCVMVCLLLCGGNLKQCWHWRGSICLNRCQQGSRFLHCQLSLISHIWRSHIQMFLQDFRAIHVIHLHQGIYLDVLLDVILFVWVNLYDRIPVCFLACNLSHICLITFLENLSILELYNEHWSEVPQETIRIQRSCDW
jgi:hypothetical protein